MASDIVVTAHSPRGMIQSKQVLRAWAEREPESVTFIGLDQADELPPGSLPEGAQLSVRGGRGTIGRARITKGGGFRVS